MLVFLFFQTFETKEALDAWVKSTGLKYLMILITKRSDSAKGRSPRIWFGCERQGSYKSSNSTKATGTKRLGCPFELKGSMTNKFWKIDRVVCGRHNHKLAEHLEGHAYSGRLNKEELKSFTDMSKGGVKPKAVLNILKERDPTNTSTLQTLYNEKKKIQKEYMDDRTQMQQLMKLTAENGYVVADRRERETHRVTNLFWAHPDAISLLKCFPNVLIMDSTYKTNVFDFALFEVVGVTSTMRTFAVCYCAMLSEDTENFSWTLQRLKELVDVEPDTIVTDRALALMKACEQVFPKSYHLLCRWHIKMAVHAKIQIYLPKEDNEEVENPIGDLSTKNKRPSKESDQNVNKGESLKAICKDSWSRVVYSETQELYESRWREMSLQFAAYPELIEYIKDTWLIYKEKFVSVWTQKTMHFGNTSTNRVESAHSMLKGAINNTRRHTFLGLWTLIHTSWHTNFTTIKASFEQSLNSVQHEHRIKMFDYLRGNISNFALKLMKLELTKIDSVHSDGSHCRCVLRTSYGLPCAHEMKKISEERECKCLILSDVHNFWKKLNAVPSRKGLEDLEVHEEFGIFLDYYRNSPPERKSFLLQRLKELGRPQTTWLMEPRVVVQKAATKKRSRKTQEDIFSSKRDPSGFEYSPLASESSVAKPKQPIRRRPYYMRTTNVTTVGFQSEYLLQVPEEFRTYVQRVEDVKPDGNCGFRAVARGLGRQEEEWLAIRRELKQEFFMYPHIYDNMFGDGSANQLAKVCDYEGSFFAPMSKWLVLPQFGFGIANAYNCLVVTISQSGRSTYLPMHSSPPPLGNYYPELSILHVPGHFMHVALKPFSPIPEAGKTWEKHRQAEAIGWDDLIRVRTDQYNILYGRQDAFDFTQVIPLDLTDDED